ncbi:MAG TPA: YdcF family protein [Bryobacteraceae bacterium]|nr:YdcF family protein [Bryobacteraceae bacterium]
MAAIGAVVFRTQILTALAKPLVEDDGPHTADAILVMGGDGFCTRIIKAAELAKAGYVPVVYVSSPPIFTAHEADFTIPFAIQHGYPATLFRALPSDADSTRDEAVLLGQMLRARNVHTVLLVTSNYHTARAVRLMRKYNRGLTFYVEPASDPYFRTNGWWHTRTGEKTFILEWTKHFAAALGI